MSAPGPTLEDRILTLLADQGSVPARDMGRWLSGIDRGALDAALTGLMRRNRVTLVLNHYSLTSKLVAHVPTAAEEVAAALNPSERRCKGKCGAVKPLEEFHKNPSCPGGRDTTCKTCRQERKSERRSDRKPNTTYPSGPEPGLRDGARHPPAGVIDRDEAPPSSEPASEAGQPDSGRVADDSAERRSGGGHDTAEPTPRSAEPEKGDRQSSQDALGKAPAVQSSFKTVVIEDGARKNALARKVALTSQLAVIEQEIASIDQFIEMYDRFAGAA